jgi:hypothetical protein
VVRSRRVQPNLQTRARLTRKPYLASRTSITQQVIIDDEVIAFIVYDLDRSPDSRAGPSVELTGFQKYAGNKETESSSPIVSYGSQGSSRYSPRALQATPMDRSQISSPQSHRSSYRRM